MEKEYVEADRNGGKDGGCEGGNETVTEDPPTRLICQN